MRRRLLAVLALASLTLPASAPAAALGLSPDPAVFTDQFGFGSSFSFDFLGFTAGVPAGGVVLDGSVSPSDVTLLLRVTVLDPGSFTLPFVPFWGNNTEGLGTIPGPGGDVIEGQATLHAFALVDTSPGAVSDVVFISASEVGVGDELWFYAFDGIAQVVVPEPATALLVASGLLGLAARRRPLG